MSDPQDLERRGIEALRRGDRAAGADLLKQAIAGGAGTAGAFTALGGALLQGEDFGDAEAAFRSALDIDPHRAAAHRGLGIALLRQGDVAGALSCCARAVELEPGSAGNQYLAAVCLLTLGRIEDSVPFLRKAVELDPAHRSAHTNLIWAAEHSSSSTLEEQQSLRRLWCERHAKEWLANPGRHANTREPDRRLRVGYVSADFRAHSAALAFGPLIFHHDAAEFELFCYSSSAAHDHVSDALKNASEHWHSAAGVSDETLAARIREDGIDILVDLSGYSKGQRQLVFARKPAPIQATGWGHAFGTGMTAMDYLFSDPVTIPAEERDQFVEEIVDLPCCLCYEAPGPTPPESPLPALEGKPFTFGSLNRAEKLSKATVALWSRILRAMPQSRLLLKGARLENPSMRAYVLRAFQDCGIDPGRLSLLGSTSQYQHQQALQQVDLCLDPFPCSGGITTIETLLMGVPVVTLSGGTPASRVSAAVLAAAGMSEWIAGDEDEYEQIALEMAEDPPHLARIRRDVRQRLLMSPVCDTRRYAKAVEAAYRRMWRRWCGAGR